MFPTPAVSGHSNVRVFLIVLVAVVLVSPAGCGRQPPEPLASFVASQTTPSKGSPSPTTVRTPAAPPCPLPTATASLPAATPLSISLQWRLPTDEMVWSLGVDDLNGDGSPELVAGSYDKHVYALTSSGESLWRYAAGAAVYAVDTGDLDGDGQAEVVVGADDNLVYALRSDGALLWRYDAGGRVVSVLTADLDADGVKEVYAGTWAGQLYSLDAHGEQNWRFAGRDGLSVLMAVDLDQDGPREIVAGSRDGTVYAVASDGRLRWDYRTGGFVRGLRAYDLDGDGRQEIVVGSADGWLYVLDDGGRTEWTYQLNAPIAAVAVGDVDGDGQGEIVAGTGREGRHVYLLSSGGRVRWRYEAAKGVWAVEMADLEGDGSQEVVAGGDDGVVRILDAHGRLRGSYATDRRVHGLAVADLTGDGWKEIVARSGNDVYALTVAPSKEAAVEPDGLVENVASARWSESSAARAAPASDQLIELVAVGDIMLSRTIEERMELYGSSYPFLGTVELLRAADIAIGNLECPLSTGGEPIDKRFTFRAHPDYAQGLAWAGLDIVNLANNHLLDFGTEGLASTLKALDENALAYVGAGLSYAEAHRPLIWDVKGKRVAFLAYAATRWKGSYELPTEQEVSFAEAPTITHDVQRAKAEADLVVVMMHLGTEYQGYPDDEQLTVARTAIEAGACLVIGHHPHVVQGTASYGDGFIAYSLGNFVFDIDVVEEAREGAVLRVLLGSEGVEVAELIPVWIADDVQPRFMTDDEGQVIVDRVF